MTLCNISHINTSTTTLQFLFRQVSFLKLHQAGSGPTKQNIWG